MKINSLKLGEIFLYFYPILLISGPFLTELFSALVIIVLLISGKIKKKLFKNNILYFFIFFNLYLILNLIINYNFENIFKNIFFFRIILFNFIVGFIVYSNNNILKNFNEVIYFVLFILFFDTLIEYFFNKNMFGLEVSDKNRFSSFFGDEKILGSFVFRLIPIYFIIKIYLKETFKKKDIFLVIISLFLVIFSGERLSFLMYLMFIFFLILNCLNFKLFLKAFFILLLITLFALAILNNARLYELLELSNYNLNSSLIKFHLSHYQTAVSIFNEHPIFGIGLNNFSEECKNFFDGIGCANHPHNIIMQVMSELGMIGVLFLFIIYYKIFSELIINFKKNDLFFVIYLSLLINFMPLLPYGNLFNNWLMYISFLPISFLFLIYFHSHEKK